MHEPFDLIALYDALSPDEQADLDRHLRDDPALAEALARWQSLRAAVRRDLGEALPDRALLVLYALSDAPLDGAPAPSDLLDAADRACLDAASADLRVALDRHPGLLAAVRSLRADRAAFEQVWNAHTQTNGRAEPARPAPALDRPAVRRERSARPSRWAWRSAVLAAVVVFGTVLAYVFQRDAGFETIRAAEATTVALPDGSSADLAAGAELLVPTSDAADVRQARLMTGRAVFTVRHDPEAPFRIETPNAEVTVLGTTFGLVVDDISTEVVLVSGAVALASRGASDAPVRLDPGERSRVLALDAPASPEPADVDAALAWTGDVFVQAERLDAVALRLSRLFGAPVTVDEALASETVSATRFERSAGVEAALEELALSLGARVTTTDDGLHLAPAASI